MRAVPIRRPVAQALDLASDWGFVFLVVVVAFVLGMGVATAMYVQLAPQ